MGTRAQKSESHLVHVLFHEVPGSDAWFEHLVTRPAEQLRRGGADDDVVAALVDVCYRGRATGMYSVCVAAWFVMLALPLTDGMHRYVYKDIGEAAAVVFLTQLRRLVLSVYTPTVVLNARVGANTIPEFVAKALQMFAGASLDLSREVAGIVRERSALPPVRADDGDDVPQGGS